MLERDIHEHARNRLRGEKSRVVKREISLSLARQFAGSSIYEIGKSRISYSQEKDMVGNFALTFCCTIMEKTLITSLQPDNGITSDIVFTVYQNILARCQFKYGCIWNWREKNSWSAIYISHRLWLMNESFLVMSCFCKEIKNRGILKMRQLLMTRKLCKEKLLP